MNTSRRNAFKLSAAAVALLAGNPALAQGEGHPQDIQILNVALGLEWEGIHAYTLGAQSGLLKKPVLDTAVRFQADHKEHADTLAGAIRRMGGKPVEPRPLAEYARALNADRLKTQNDVLDLAARLELGATNAYLGVTRPSTTATSPRWRRASSPTRSCTGRSSTTRSAGRFPRAACPSAPESAPAVRLRGPPSPRRAGGFFTGARRRRGSEGVRVLGSCEEVERHVGRRNPRSLARGPRKVDPGQKIGFSVRESADRTDIIEYLRGAK